MGSIRKTCVTKLRSRPSAPLPSIRRVIQSSSIHHAGSSRYPAFSLMCSRKTQPDNAKRYRGSRFRVLSRRDQPKWSWKMQPDDATTVPWLAFSVAFSRKKLLILLRDGRKLLGILRSFDQFANAVLEGACERVIVGDLYCDISLGLYVIRGENVVLIGELDLEKEELPPHMTRVSETEIKMAQKVEREATDLKGSMLKRMEFLDMD
ncbi:hypothetical protein CTI12_AA312310 [Artemisia annua]|uniref:U6 snRNA-associated Sm-like protein LSm1 n=1 Tax=Artemisia annua TaxID=35608 RepID=A0A2U1N3L5_ARTAN|nr:hypothetical protein CTI12_AA312310 [Artemisia annua]